MDEEAAKRILEAYFIASSINIEDDSDSGNIVDALYFIGRGLREIAVQIKYLGLADAGTPMGAIEVLASKVGEVADAIYSTKGGEDG